MENYRVVKSEQTYQGVITEVFQDTITLPNGKTTLREVVHRGNASAVVAVNHEGKVLFVRQYRHPAKEMSLEIPAGMHDSENEDPKDCALRELEEETGYRAKHITDLTKFYSAVGFCTEMLYLYLAEDLEKTQQDLDEDEFVTIELYTLEEAINMILNGEIHDAKTIIGILAYQIMLSRRG